MSSDPDAVARKISADTAALAREARAAGLETLGYLLDMARLEANAQFAWKDGESNDG